MGIIIIVINNIRQGSVASHLKYDVMFKYHCFKNLVLCLTAKNFENCQTFCEVMDKTVVAPFFDSQCIWYILF